MKRLTLKIHGQVQGVFFRAKAQEKALDLGLIGWVKNADDGTVDLVAEGEEDALKELVQFCKGGPEHASVSKVDERLEEIEDATFEGFEIRY